MKTLRSYPQFYLFLSPVKQKSEYCRVPTPSFLLFLSCIFFYVVCLVEWDKEQNTLTPAFKTHTHTHTHTEREPWAHAHTHTHAHTRTHTHTHTRRLDFWASEQEAECKSVTAVLLQQVIWVLWLCVRESVCALHKHRCDWDTRRLLIQFEAPIFI